MTQEDFIYLALKGFSLGYALGFGHWAFSYACKVIRRSFFTAARIVDI